MLVRFRSEVMNSLGFGLPLDPIDPAENSARLPVQPPWTRVLATNKLFDLSTARPYGTIEALVAIAVALSRAQHRGRGNILRKSRSSQVARGKLVNVIAFLIRQPQIAAAIECDRLQMHKLGPRDSKNRIDVLISRRQATDLSFVESEDLAVATLTVDAILIDYP